jgi:hypothetical protein
MNKRYWIINLLCICSLVGLVWKLRKDWHQYAAANGPQAVQVHALAGVPTPPPVGAGDYRAIAQQNPFHADRNDVISQPVEAKPSGPPPLVYGSIILGDTRFALLATEQSPKPERVPEGSTFAGYRLVHVLPQSVVFESGSSRQEIMLYNALERLHRQAAKTTATAKPPAAAPVVNASPSPSPSPTTTAAPIPSSAAIPAAAPPGKEVMQTPFGPIFIDKKKP